MDQTNSLRALVVDDSATLRSRLVEMLTEIDGAVVSEAENAADAMREVRASRPDVVILDIHMPGVSGIEVLREIKRDYRDTAVIMLTNHAEPQYRAKCKALRADYFLCKSTDLDVLIQISKRMAIAKADPRAQESDT